MDGVQTTMGRPNIVLVVIDTARYRGVFPSGPHSTMPTVQKLAAEGVQFKSASSSSPWTLPSHASLFSGKPPSVHGAHALHKRFESEPTLTHLIRETGYTTLGFSNNTWVSAEFGFDRGFDEFVTSWQLFQDAPDFGDIEHEYYTTVDRLRAIISKFSGNPVKNIANILFGKYFRKRHDKGARRTNRLVRDQLDNLGSRSEPYFLFINYLEPHLPYDPPAEYADQWLPNWISRDQAKAVNQDAWGYITGQVEMTQRDFEILQGLYRGELAYLDSRINELLATIEEHSTSNETVIVITSDHGENIGEHSLMDHQYSIFETLLHVPLVISGPGFDDGSAVEEPVQLTDLYPTILDLAGADAPDLTPHGRSLIDYCDLSGQREIFAEYIGPQPSIETLRERYDIKRDISKFDRRLRAVRTGGYKYIAGSDGSEWLFNLDKDPDEMTNLVESDHERRDELSSTIETWVDSLPPIQQADIEIDRQTENRLEDLGYLT